jgi:hypothetical protein
MRRAPARERLIRRHLEPGFDGARAPPSGTNDPRQY